MKTPEQKAEEYVANAYIVFPQSAVKTAYIAGYNAALENTKPKNICEHVYVSNLDPDEEDYDLICKKCGHRTN